MADVQTYNGISGEQKTFYEKTLLIRALAKLVFMKFGQKKALPGREGDTIKFRKFESLTPVTQPITEGVTPAGNSLNVTTLTAAVSEYGDFVRISDKLNLVGVDAVLTETAELLGESAGLALDTVVRNIVCAGTNVQYAGGAATANAIAAASRMTAEEVRKAVRTLRKANIKTIDGSYVGIIDPDIAFDIFNDPLWQDVSKYNGGAKIMSGEVGKLSGVRFIETTNTKTYDNTATPALTLHCAMIIGQDAYGVVDIEGKSSPEMIVKGFGSGGSEDPLNQRASSGWKALMTAVRLNEMAMVRVEVPVSGQ